MQTFLVAVALLALPLGLAGWWMLRPRLLAARRARHFRRPLADRQRAILERRISQYALLPAELKAELHGHISVFLAEKRFRGCNGQVIDEDVRVTIAGNACLLLLRRNATYFPGFNSILVYPDTFESFEIDYDGEIEIHERTQRAGESWHRGPVILSWGDVLRGAGNPEDGFNVVLHEFAHKLDEENGDTDGLPVLEARDQYAEWAAILGREFRELVEDVDDGDDSVMDDYGATSPAEFFAVATETYFEKPRQMRKRLPELYEQLRRFYIVDPAEWFDRAARKKSG